MAGKTSLQNWCSCDSKQLTGQDSWRRYARKGGSCAGCRRGFKAIQGQLGQATSAAPPLDALSSIQGKPTCSVMMMFFLVFEAAAVQPASATG